MARPRKSRSSGAPLSPGQASYILDKLIAERRISAGDVNRYVGDMGREISELEQRLQALRAAHVGGGAARRGRPPGRPAGSAAQGGRRRRRRGGALTAEQRASRQLQGKYLSLIRQIPASRRGQYSRMAKEKGREAAIKELQNVIKK